MRIIEILITAEKQSGKTQGDIAREAGMTPTELSDKLAGRKPFTEQDIIDLAPVLRTHPSTLMGEVSRKDLLDLVRGREKKLTQGIGKAKAAEKPNLRALPEPDYTLALDNDLDAIKSIDEADDRVAIPLWPESVAATDLQKNDPDPDQRHVWVPADYRKIYGAKVRAIEVRGESMIRAGIEPGDVIFVRLISDPATAQGKISIIETEDGMTLKRLRGDTAVAESDRSYPTIKLGPEARVKAYAVGIYKPPRKT